MLLIKLFQYIIKPNLSLVILKLGQSKKNQRASYIQQDDDGMIQNLFKDRSSFPRYKVFTIFLIQIQSYIGLRRVL